MANKKKKYYILRDMDNDDRFGNRHLFSDKKPTTDEPQLVITGVIQVSGDIDLLDKYIG